VVERGADGARSYVVLADTILYPEGGGQPSDGGRIADVEVEAVHTVGGAIRHYVAGVVREDRVTVELDWARRFDHMQQHTGQHLLTAMAVARFGWQTTAFHLGQSGSDIEVDAPGISAAALDELEGAVASEIRASRAVTSRRVSPEEFARLAVRSRGLPEGHQGDIRLVEIDGVDVNTCGGTHVRTTAEIEALKLLGSEPMRGGTRVYFLAGGRVRRRLAAHEARSAALRALLGGADDDIPGLVAARLEQLKEAGRRVRAVEEELAVETARALAAGSDRAGASHWPQRDAAFLQRVARELVALAPARALLLTAGEGEEGAFVLCAGADVALDVGSLGREIAGILQGRGGGAGRLFQGKATRLSRRAEAAERLRAAVSGG
jgi:alanyl-tRNA synthetase